MSKTDITLVTKPSHLTPEMDRKWASLKPETQYFLSKTISHPSFEDAIDAIKDTHAMHGIDHVGMLLQGGPGLGKSTILKKYKERCEKHYEGLTTDTLTKQPIILLSIPPRPTINSLMREILRATGQKTTGDGATLRTRLLTLIDEQYVELIIFDEYQHFHRSRAQKNTLDVVDFIKTLMNEKKLSIVMAGVDQGYEDLQKHEDLYQRFTFEQVHLKPFSLETEDDYWTFHCYIEMCEGFLKEANVECISLTDEGTLKKILLATRGHPRFISRLLVKVLEKGDLTKKLVKKNFATAYSRMGLNPKLGTNNPFEMSDEKVAEKLEKGYA